MCCNRDIPQPFAASSPIPAYCLQTLAPLSSCLFHRSHLPLSALPLSILGNIQNLFSLGGIRLLPAAFTLNRLMAEIGDALFSHVLQALKASVHGAENTHTHTHLSLRSRIDSLIENSGNGIFFCFLRRSSSFSIVDYSSNEVIHLSMTEC